MPEIHDKHVRDIMSTDVKTLGRNDALTLADDLMAQARIRHLPVLDEDGRLAGVVSQRDLFRGALAKAIGFGEVGQRKMMATLVVKEVMATEVVTIAPTATVAEAAKLLIDRKVGCLPVIDGERLVGIVTETDLVRLLT